jgi:undecaprenyl phosphate N,N'-diacetylbacillosamine 1-phosphate transferase
MKKRIFDVSIVLFFFPIWFSLIVLIIILSFFFNGSPIFFLQLRGGYKNKKIRVIKFRTIDNYNKINTYSHKLRFFKLDELPQLINVLKGDLSLVGPRPLIYEYKKLYKKKHLKRFDVKPGITGLSQIYSDHKTTWLKKFDLDLEYVKNQNFFLDLTIMFLTIKKLIFSFITKNKKTLQNKKFNGTN